MFVCVCPQCIALGSASSLNSNDCARISHLCGKPVIKIRPMGDHSVPFEGRDTVYDFRVSDAVYAVVQRVLSYVSFVIHFSLSTLGRIRIHADRSASNGADASANKFIHSVVPPD